MNVAQLSRIIPASEINEACLDILVEKVTTSERRKNNFGDSGNGHKIRKRHLTNHAGTYRDEYGKAPKYHKLGHKKTYPSPITDKLFLKAYGSVFHGRKNSDDFRKLPVIHRKRLEYVQALREAGQIDPYRGYTRILNEIKEMNLKDINRNIKGIVINEI